MKKRRRKGFTLVELLIVITIIGGLIAILTPVLWRALNKNNQMLCQNNLRQISMALFLYKDRFGKWPQEKGPKFILSLWKTGIVDQTRKNSRLFLCPGIPLDLEDNDEGRAYDDWDNINSSMCGYACRDVEKYKIVTGKKSKKDDPNYPNLLIVSDDSEDPLNHEFKINILLADGTIDEVDVSLFEETGFAVGDEGLEPETDEMGRYLWPDFRVLTEECD